MERREQLEHIIRECSDYFDNIRICDGGSTDGTKAMCDRLGVEYRYRKWDDKYHEADNLLLSFARKNDWVMIMDDDECPSRPLLDNLLDLIEKAKKQRCNMISLPSLLVLDDEPEDTAEEFIRTTVEGSRRPFRKNWLFRYDRSIRSYGSPHRGVESNLGWRIYNQPYPYFHYKTSWSFTINDCVHGWIDPFTQRYSREEADEMHSVMPEFETSREIEKWLREGDVGFEFLAFAQKHKDSDRPIRNWWICYCKLRGLDVDLEVRLAHKG